MDAYLGYWWHGKFQRWGSYGLAELQLIFFVEALVLGVRGPAVLRDEGVHSDVACVLVLQAKLRFLNRRREL